VASAELPAGETEFDGQPEHAASAVAASDAEYLPAAQSVHNAAPVPGLYFPATHAANAPPFGPVYPALATHVASAELPAGEDEPVAQGWQVEPAREYVPAPQAVQAASAELLAGEEEPAAQFWHADPAAYFPTAHAAQAPAAELPADEIDPEGHA
jgi:hypothetical protein